MVKWFAWLTAFIALPAMALAAHGGPHPRTTPALVKTAPARILVNQQGITLYVYALDKRNTSTCNGACATYWPPVLLPKGVTAPSAAGINGVFGSARRANGAHQLTYEGMPLYTFVKDKKPGDMAGQGVAGVWWAVVVGASAAAPAATSDASANQGTATPPSAGGAPAATATPGGSYSRGGYGQRPASRAQR